MDIMEKISAVAYRDERISEVMLKMNGNKVGKLVVVDRTDPDRLFGIVSKTDIVVAYAGENLKSGIRLFSFYFLEDHRAL